MLDGSFPIGEILSFIWDLLYLVAVMGTIIVIILDNRNPVKSLAWLLVLIFLPLVGLVFYFFFGRSGRKVRIITKKSYSRLLKKPMAEYLAQQDTNLPEKYLHLISFFRNTNQALPFDANRVEVYYHGKEMIASLLTELRKATQHIHLEFYIFEDDEVGREVQSILMEKARAGLEVRVIYDDVGCWKVPSAFFEEMRGAGVETRAFLKARFPLFTSSVNYRNHRKIVVIDGRIGFVGGMNLAQRYVDGGGYASWRDTHLLVEGKAVHGLQTAFLLDWYFVDRTLLTSTRYFPRLEPVDKSLVQVVTSDPVGPWREIMQGLMMIITGARKYLYVQTPYFLPTESILIAMRTAAASGVDVRLMLPAKADHVVTGLASYSYLEDVLEAGVKVYFYESGFLHAKSFVCDDDLLAIGSVNLDFRSFEHNFEISAFVYNEAIARHMKEQFLADQKHCTQLFLKNWVKRPWYRKAAESLLRLLAPLL